MRRKDRVLSDEIALRTIDESEYATLSTIDDNGEIFAIPISIAREDDSIFIHGANTGTKAKLFQNGRRVSIVCVSYNKVPIVEKEALKTMMSDHRALGSKVFTTEYKSAVAKTKAYEVSSYEEKIHALKLLCEKYTPEYMSAFETAVHGGVKTTKIYEFKILNLSAKAKIL